MVRFEFDNIDFTKQTQRKRMPEASDLMLRADTLAIQYEDYTPTETSKDGKKMGMKITKTTSVDKEDNDGLYYPRYTINLSEECFDTRTLD